MSNRVIASYDVGSMSWTVSKKNAGKTNIQQVMTDVEIDTTKKLGKIVVALGTYGQDQEIALALGPKDEVKKFQVAWDKAVDEGDGDLEFPDLLKKAIKAC